MAWHQKMGLGVKPLWFTLRMSQVLGQGFWVHFLGLSDPAPTSALSKKPRFRNFFDGMKPNSTPGQSSGFLDFFFLIRPDLQRSVFFFPSPTAYLPIPYLLLFPSFLSPLPFPAHNFFIFLLDLFIYFSLVFLLLLFLFEAFVTSLFFFFFSLSLFEVLVLFLFF